MGMFPKPIKWYRIYFGWKFEKKKKKTYSNWCLFMYLHCFWFCSTFPASWLLKLEDSKWDWQYFGGECATSYFLFVPCTWHVLIYLVNIWSDKVVFFVIWNWVVACLKSAFLSVLSYIFSNYLTSNLGKDIVIA